MDQQLTTIVTALVMGAAEALKPTAANAIKDAYAGLKRLIQDKYEKASSSIETLEKIPESEDVKGIVLKDLAEADADKDEELIKQAERTIEVVGEHSSTVEGSTRIILESIKAGTWKITDIVAKGNLIIKATQVDADTFEMGGLRSGQGDSKSPNS